MNLLNLKQVQIDWLLDRGVSPSAISQPTLMKTCAGQRAKDGRFDVEPEGHQWFVFEEEHDLVFWQPVSGEIVTETGRAFALGEEFIDNPATTAFDQHLNIYTDPLEWLQHERRGIVVLKWQFAFVRLRDVPRIAVAEPLLPTYRHHMRPQRMPRLAVLPKAERTAA